MIPLLAATYGAVFLAEVGGDKLLYTTCVLGARFKRAAIILGMSLAFMVKMAVATAVGGAITRLPAPAVAAVTAASFLWLARLLWRGDDAVDPSVRDDRVSRAAVVSFAAILFSEWGDPGQLTAATMAARFGAPAVVWVGAVAAVVTKGAIAAIAGDRIRGWMAGRVPSAALRYGAVTIVAALGVLSAIDVVRAAR